MRNLRICLDVKMKNFSLSFILLFVSIILTIFLLIYLLKKKTHTQLRTVFITNCIFTLIVSIGVFVQSICSSVFNIDPIVFENFIYIGTCFVPVSAFFTSSIFVNTKIKFKKSYLLLFVVPIVSLLILWTNNYHHLFYIKYSSSFSETINGPYMTVHTLYSYLLLFISIARLLHFSIKNSGFFSKQSLLIIFGFSCPILVNVLGGVLKIIPMTVFATPICFSIYTICVTLAIFKFDFFKVAPIALQRVVDRMSDGYIIVNEENIITDFNQTFLILFALKSTEVRNVNLFDLLGKISNNQSKNESLIKAIGSTRNNDKTVKLERHFSNLNKYFNIEINSIRNKDSYLGTLILLKDVTQHNIDMETIKNNQEILIEKERLASLGQMIGGIAHNLKTPIMSIAGATEGLKDLIVEYDSSIGDIEVTNEDHHEIAHDMQVWIDKINTHLAYMSDIITAVKGQAVAFSDNTFNGFTITELVRHVDILMKHELKNALIELKTNIQIDPETKVNGNINSLVQVINNIISNAIQAYNGEPNKSIIFDITKQDSMLLLSIQDFAGGLPDSVKEKLFKEMVTTKGKNGTGLGLFMSYSNIKAHFNGIMRYDTKKGKGTTFYIEIPIQ